MALNIYSESTITEAMSTAVAHLGYAQLKELQERAIRCFLRGNDVFVCLPTGSGKSLCYCLLPKAFDVLRKVHNQSIVVVVSPLIALMKDQVRVMSQRNVTTVYACETDVTEDIKNGKFQLVFVSPETLLNGDRWHDALLGPVFQQNLVGITIDEAHCVKTWQVFFLGVLFVIHLRTIVSYLLLVTGERHLEKPSLKLDV